MTHLERLGPSTSHAQGPLIDQSLMLPFSDLRVPSYMPLTVFGPVRRQENSASEQLYPDSLCALTAILHQKYLWPYLGESKGVSYNSFSNTAFARSSINLPREFQNLGNVIVRAVMQTDLRRALQSHQ